MTDTIDELEHALVRDLDALGERFADDELANELYRALTNNALSKRGSEGHHTLSRTRAEETVNALRERHGDGPLPLAQTGGEGDVSERVKRLLEPLGWGWRPLEAERNSLD